MERDHTLEVERESFLLSHIARTIRKALPLIALTVLIVAIAYALFATAVILLSPSQRLVSLPFRLEFQGAERGQYPSGMKFSSAEIVSTPILRRVYDANGLSRFVPFQEFSQSIFVIESNAALDELSREYVSRLSDPKLSPIDRERLEAEYREKRASLARNEYAITFASDTAQIPATLVAKSLSDVLNTWAEVATNEKGVLKYQLPVLSAAVLQRDILNSSDIAVALDVLRTRIDTVLWNIRALEEVPGATVLRGGPDRLSLAEIRLALADTLRFRVSPLLLQLRVSNASPNPAGTIRFLQSQLAYNERQAEIARARVEALRQSLSTYQQSTVPPTWTSDSQTQDDGVTAQLSDSFLDRLIQITRQSDDLQYRQDLVSRINEAALEVVPYEQEISYYRELIGQVRDTPGSAGAAAGDVRAEMTGILEEVGSAIQHVNAIYDIISFNLNPSTVLYTLTSPPISRIERTVSLRQLALWGVLLLLLAGTIAGAVVLFLDRIKREEALEHEIEHGRDVTPQPTPEVRRA